MEDKIKNKNAANGKSQNTFSCPEENLLNRRCLNSFSSSVKTEPFSSHASVSLCEKRDIILSYMSLTFTAYSPP